MTYDFGDGESDADGGVGEGHDGGEDWEPWEVMEVWNLTQNHLDGCEYGHVWVVWDFAALMVTVLVKTVWPFHRPADHEN